VLAKSAQKIVSELLDDALVLDVGGWHSPFARADWVLDLMPYETRGSAPGGRESERFTADTWIQRDVCAREPWPFRDRQFAFAACSHTLEDVRDPVWVCSELARVATAGYLEVPSRLEEQTWGVNGEWVGWSHHHWLVDLSEGEARFTLKPHFLHARPDLQLSFDRLQGLDPAKRVQTLFWEGKLTATESVHYDAEALEDYLRAPLDAAGLPGRDSRTTGVRGRIRSMIRGGA
jgi:hypothetical protein